MSDLCQVCGKRLGEKDVSVAVAVKQGGAVAGWLTGSICQDCFTKKDLNDILPHNKAGIAYNRCSPLKTERRNGKVQRKEWFVYDMALKLVLSGHETELDARRAAERAERIARVYRRPVIAVLPRGDARIQEYASTHPWWAEAHGFSTKIGGEDGG